jgi:hypothetical protein
MQYSRGGYNAGAPSRFISVFDLYMWVTKALYAAHILLGDILERDYDFPVSSEFAMFGFAADRIARACDRKLKALSGAGATAKERESVLNIKGLAEWMKVDLKKRGFKGPEVVGAQGKP